MADEPTVRGSRIVIPLVAVLAVGLAILIAYKLDEPRPATMAFERAAGEEANATVLAYKEVHADRLLEAHLTAATREGNSTESVALRVDAMERTLRDLTGRDGPWLVSWNGVAVRVTVAAA